MDTNNTLSTENMGLQKYGMILLVAGIATFIISFVFNFEGDYVYWISIVVLLSANVMLFIDSSNKGEKNKNIRAFIVGGLVLISLVIVYFVMNAQYPPPF